MLKSLKKALKNNSQKDDGHIAKFSDTAPRLHETTSDGLHESQAHLHAHLHPDAHDDGGLACKNKVLLDEMREAITQWIKSMGRMLWSGNFNLISTPFPVVMFEPRSYLAKLCDVWVYPRYLQQATAAQDPLLRMQLVVTWFVAGLHHGFEKWKKPFNPILGETWQASLSDGSSIHLEQISHHPPVTAFNLFGPGNAYTYTGLSQPNVTLALKYYGFKTVAKGFRYIQFADGTRIDIQYPGYYIKGVVYSSYPRAEVDGQAVFTDNTHGLKAVLRFGANKGARAPVMRRSDAVVGEIYQVPCREVSRQQESLVPSSREASQTPNDEPLDLFTGNSRTGNASDGQEGVDGEADDEGWETASETDWTLRELRDAAEQQRDTVADIGAEVALKCASRGRLLADAASGVLAHAQGETLGISGRLISTGVATPSQSSTELPSVRDSAGSRERVTVGSSCPQQSPFAPIDDRSIQHRHSLPLPAGSTGTKSSATSTGPAGAHVDARTSYSGAGGGGHPGAMSASASRKASDNGFFSGFSKFMSSAVQAGGSDGSDEEQDGSVPGACVLSRIEGSWLSHLNFDNRRFWTLSQEQPDTWQPVPNPLPSDSKYREDLQQVWAGEVKAAQQWKETLENRQRKDKKLREAGGAPGHHGHKHR